MYELFYNQKSAAVGIRAVLEEMSLNYKLIQTDITDHVPRDPKLLEHNPNGWVPVLVYDGGAMHEASAITIFLTDRHPEFDLAPRASDPKRGSFLQWLVYMSNTLQMAYQLTYYPWRFCETSDFYEQARVRSCVRLREIWNFIDQAIGGNKWMLGEKFSALDIHVYMLSTWLSEDKGHPDIREFPNASRLAVQASARDSIKKAYQLD